MKPLVPALALLALSACATMVNGRNERVPVDSYPSGAAIAVDCGDVPRDGGVTPAKVTLARIETNCSVTLTKDGYEPKTVVFSRQNSRAVAINKVAAAPIGIATGLLGLVLGSSINAEDEGAAIGWQAGIEGGSAPGRAVDRHTGAAYKQVPGDVFVTLVPR